MFVIPFTYLLCPFVISLAQHTSAFSLLSPYLVVLEVHEMFCRYLPLWRTGMGEGGRGSRGGGEGVQGRGGGVQGGGVPPPRRNEN